MDKPPASIRLLARQLLAIESASHGGTGALGPEAGRVCEKLQISLTRFAGAEGFASLLRRSLALARAEVPSLQSIELKPDGSLVEVLAADTTDGAAAIIAHLLGLLVTFIGEPITLRLVREAWPDASLDNSQTRGDS